jgi:hypothetical protein
MRQYVDRELLGVPSESNKIKLPFPVLLALIDSNIMASRAEYLPGTIPPYTEEERGMFAEEGEYTPELFEQVQAFLQENAPSE